MKIEFTVNKVVFLTAIHIVSSTIDSLNVDSEMLTSWKMTKMDLANAKLFKQHLHFKSTDAKNTELTLTFTGELNQLEAFSNVIDRGIQVFSTCAYNGPEEYRTLQKLDFAGVSSFRNQLLEFIPGETKKGCFLIISLTTEAKED